MPLLMYGRIQQNTFSRSLVLQVWLSISFLLYHVAALEKTAADYYVRSLPGQPAGELLKMHAG